MQSPSLLSLLQYFLGLLAGSILTFPLEGGFGTLAGGKLVTFGKPFAAAAGALVTPLTPGSFGNPSTGALGSPPLTPGSFGNPSTGALGSPPLVFGLLAGLILTLPAVEEPKGLELTGGKDAVEVPKGLELTGGRDETEGFGTEGLGRPPTEGTGLPPTTLLGFDAADTAVFLTAPAYEGVFAPSVLGLDAGAGSAFCAEEGAAGSAFCAEEGAAGSAFCFAIAPAPLTGAGRAFCFLTAVGAEPGFGAVAAIARSP
jgi:hypothetical protein